MPSRLSPSKSGTIRVGPAGWSYKDWAGVVYPESPGKGFDPLAYLAHYYDTIEVNSSFYRIPPPTHALSWIRRTGENPDFRFTAKLFRGFTHERSKNPEDVRAYRRFLDPLAEAGKLGAVLIQFPWSFRSEPDSYAWMEQLFRDFAPYPKVVEVRHGKFQTGELLRFLEENDVGFANIDQPIVGESVRPSAVATGPVGYVRLHGRNYAKWFQHDESWERYDYLYSLEELEPWVGRIREIATERDVYVVTNNHFRGQAIVNATEIRGALGQSTEAPPPLREAYPDRFPEKE